MSGIKNDAGKPRTDFLPPLPLVEVARAMGHGALKYDPWNYRKGFKRTRLLGAALRHLFAWAAREDKDPDSGLSHLAHAAASCLMLLDMEILDVGEDDRWRGEPKVETPYVRRVEWLPGEPLPTPDPAPSAKTPKPCWCGSPHGFEVPAG